MVKSSRVPKKHLFKGDGMNQQNHFWSKTVASVLPCQSLPYRVIIRLTTLWLTTLWLTTLWLTRRIDGDMSALLLWLAAYGGHGTARHVTGSGFSRLDWARGIFFVANNDRSYGIHPGCHEPWLGMVGIYLWWVSLKDQAWDGVRAGKAAKKSYVRMLSATALHVTLGFTPCSWVMFRGFFSHSLFSQQLDVSEVKHRGKRRRVPDKMY